MIYLVCYLISVGFAYYANRAKNRNLFWLFSAVSILIPALLAGLRAYSVGIDAENYYSLARYWGRASTADSLWDYLKYYMSIGYGEPLFALILGTIAQVFKNYSVFLFVVHAVIVTGVYIGAFRVRKYAEPWLVLVLFYLLYFGQSLNIMRQYMAMAMVFAAFADIHEKKWIRYCIVVAVAALIHTSALLALYPLLIYAILNVPWKVLDRKKWYRAGLVVALTLAGVLLLKPVVQLAMRIGLLSDKYGFYFRADVISPALLDSIFIFAGVCAVYMFRHRISKHCEHFSFYALNSSVYLILLQLSWFIIYGKRIAAYQLFANLILVAMVEKVQKKEKARRIAAVCLIGGALVYWLYAYAFRNASETMPYQFVFNILSK